MAKFLSIASSCTIKLVFPHSGGDHHQPRTNPSKDSEHGANEDRSRKAAAMIMDNFVHLFSSRSKLKSTIQLFAFIEVQSRNLDRGNLHLLRIPGSQTPQKQSPRKLQCRQKYMGYEVAFKGMKTNVSHNLEICFEIFGLMLTQIGIEGDVISTNAVCTFFKRRKNNS